MKENKYHAVGLVLKSNRKIVEGGKIATPSKQTLDNSLSDMFQLSQTFPGPFLIYDLSPGL
jgi:hypothetical protein